MEAALPEGPAAGPAAAAARAPLVTSTASEAYYLAGRVEQPCSVLEAVAALTGQGPTSGRKLVELVELGAVFVGDEVRGQPGKVVWRRVVDLAGATATASLPPGPTAAAEVAAPTDPCRWRCAAGQLLRVHPRPKRFPACSQPDWPARLLTVNPDWAVVNKPGGLPSMRHESNGVEHAAECASRALRLGPLQACHRLDQATSGVLVLGRHRAAVARFNAALRGEAGSVTKTYQALARAPVPLGPLQHCMHDGPFGAAVAEARGQPLWPRGPRLLSTHSVPGWKLCELVVEACQPAGPGAAAWWALQEGAASGGTPECLGPGHALYELRILLVTGRTHQIRAQLAAIGAPLLGDSLYGPMGGVLAGPDGELSEEGVAALARGEQVAGALGLHAWRLAWEAGAYEAPPPWAGEAAAPAASAAPG